MLPEPVWFKTLDDVFDAIRSIELEETVKFVGVCTTKNFGKQGNGSQSCHPHSVLPDVACLLVLPTVIQGNLGSSERKFWFKGHPYMCKRGLSPGQEFHLNLD